MMPGQPTHEPPTLTEEVINGLRNGPINILQAAKAYNQLRHEVEDLQRDMEAIEASIAGEVANDKTLTNEAQRKAALAQLRLTNENLIDARAALAVRKANEAEAQLAHDYARNSFQAARSLASFLGRDGA